MLPSSLLKSKTRTPRKIASVLYENSKINFRKQNKTFRFLTDDIYFHIFLSTVMLKNDVMVLYERQIFFVSYLLQYSTL